MPFLPLPQPLSQMPVLSLSSSPLPPFSPQITPSPSQSLPRGKGSLEGGAGCLTLPFTTQSCLLCLSAPRRAGRPPQGCRGPARVAQARRPLGSQPLRREAPPSSSPGRGPGGATQALPICRSSVVPGGSTGFRAVQGQFAVSSCPGLPCGEKPSLPFLPSNGHRWVAGALPQRRAVPGVCLLSRRD